MWTKSTATMEETTMPKSKHHSFNIILTKQTFAKLSHLAQQAGCTRAHFVRQLLRHVCLMDEHNQPICADGGRCVAPHLHPCTQKGNSPDVA